MYKRQLLWYVAIYRKLLIIPFYLPSLPILKAVSKLKVLAWIQFLHHNTLLRNTFYTEAELRKTLAENLVYLRKSKQTKLSQKAVARLLHLPEKTIMNYENGHTLPSAYAVFRLAQYYGCTMEDLLTQNMKKKERCV